MWQQRLIIKNPISVGLIILLGLVAFMLVVAWEAYEFRWHALWHQPTFWHSNAGILLLAGLALALLTAVSVAMQEHAKLQKLHLAKHMAEQANDLKTDFLAMVSHEMRTPLNGILGMSSLLAETQLDQRQSFYTQSIHKSGDHLLALINDLLDVAKIDAGRLELEEIDYDLHQLMQEVVDLFSIKANQKSLYLRLDIAPNVPQFVRGDLGRVRQVLFNLLSNAIKFTHTGGVHISLRPASMGQMWQIVVADTGIGIAPDKQHIIFERFKQSNHSTTREFEGTGLGLAICRDLLTLMGGSITVKSALGQGASFVCTLPLTPAQNPTAIHAVAELVVFAPCRILVAEDSITNQYVVAAMLEKFGCRTTCVANGAEAVQAVQQQPTDQMFALVLMDCHMPDMDGYEAAQRLKKSYPQLPIVALTASAMRGDREKCLAHGMDDYLAKPISKENLNMALQRWLPKAADLVVNQTDTAQLMTLKILMGQKFSELIVQFTAQGEATLAALNAVDIESAEIYQHTHKLKAAAGQLGFIALSQQAAKIEMIALQQQALNLEAVQAFATIWQQVLADIDAFEQIAEAR